MKYIKLFNTHSEYETYTESAEYVTPNICYCKNTDVHLNPEEIYTIIDYDGFSEITYYTDETGENSELAYVEQQYYQFIAKKVVNGQPQDISPDEYELKMYNGKNQQMTISESQYLNGTGIIFEPIEGHLTDEIDRGGGTFTIKLFKGNKVKFTKTITLTEVENPNIEP